MKTVEKNMKTFNGLLIATLSSLVILPGCWQKEQEKPAMKTGLVVVNVLDKEAYADCHIAGSINVPFENLETSMDTIDKSAEVVFYCSNPMCTASGYAALQFKKAGFTNVSVYEGGTAEWYQKGLPVEGASCADYLRQPVKHVADQTHEVTVLSVEELAHKLGYELPAIESKEVALGDHCMTEQVATDIEIQSTK